MLSPHNSAKTGNQTVTGFGPSSPLGFRAAQDCREQEHPHPPLHCDYLRGYIAQQGRILGARWAAAGLRRWGASAGPFRAAPPGDFPASLGQGGDVRENVAAEIIARHAGYSELSVVDHIRLALRVILSSTIPFYPPRRRSLPSLHERSDIDKCVVANGVARCTA